MKIDRFLSPSLNARLLEDALWQQKPESQLFHLDLSKEFKGLYLIHIVKLDGSSLFHQKILIL